MNLLNLPTYVEDTYGRKYSVPQTDVRFGGQGIFFQKDDLAIKMLFPEKYSVNHILESDDKEFQRYQKKLIHLMAMPRLGHLSLPISGLKAPYCGYVMRFMSGLKPLDSLMSPPPEKEGGYSAAYSTETCSLKKRIHILRNLAALLRDLHNRGLVYCDLTPNNIFASEKSHEAEVWLIDIDNLEYGNSLDTHWQTPWYRAPEVYKGQKNSACADCYSFALIAFGFLTFSKPFSGTMADALEEKSGWDDTDAWGTMPQAEEGIVQGKIESGEMPYIGESRTKNEQSYGIPIQYVTTVQMQELFLRTFGPEGRKNPYMRPSMNEWFHVLDEALDQLFLCPNGHRYFGKNCFLCGSEANAAKKRILVNQVLIYAKSAPSKTEDQEVERVDVGRRKIYEIVFVQSNSKARHRRTTTEVSIPWKCFAGSNTFHDPDAVAFNICLSEDEIDVTGNFDPKLKISIPEAKGKNCVSAIYDDRFFYELTVEEVE